MLSKIAEQIAVVYIVFFVLFVAVLFVACADIDRGEYDRPIRQPVSEIKVSVKSIINRSLKEMYHAN
mgnify:CR=1 FL=1